MKTIKIGDKIKFNLDFAVPGEGIVTDVFEYSVKVKLTKPCKEFKENTVIFVDINEISS